MNEIPMSRRDHISYNREDFNYISRWSHIPLPENNRIMRYLKRNFRPQKNLSYKIMGQPALHHGITPLPKYESDVVASDVIQNDLIIHVCTGNDCNVYIHIPKDYLDDPNPKCDFSMITRIGTLSKEEMFYSEIESFIRGNEFEILKEFAKTV